MEHGDQHFQKKGIFVRLIYQNCAKENLLYGVNDFLSSFFIILQNK